METLVHGVLGNAAAVTVLAAVVAVIGRLGRRPALIHGICLLALLKLVTPPFVPVPVSVALHRPVGPPAPVSPPGSAEVLPSSGDIEIDWRPEEPVPDEPLATELPAPWRWEAMAIAVVLTGALAWWALAAVRIVRFHRMLRDVEPMPGPWRDEADALAARLGLRRTPTACLVPGDVPPMLWALGPHVRLLVPARLWETLGHDERTALLLHELAHLKRRDHWVRWFELAVVGLYWWHPAVWWLRRMLRQSEEECCDAWVVWAMPQGGAKTYAAALVAALEFLSGARTKPAAAASATIGNGHVSSLKRRLRMIVKAKTPRGLSWAGRFAVAGLSALLLPLAPTWAPRDASASSFAELDNDLRALGDRLAADLQVVEGQARPGSDPAKKAEAARGFHGVTEGQYAHLAGELMKLDLQLIDAQAARDTALDQLERSKKVEAIRIPDAQLEDRIKEEFRKDPDIQPLIEQINEAREVLERKQDLARSSDDPAIGAARRQVAKLSKQWEELWRQKHDEIASRLQPDKGQSAKSWAEQVTRHEVTLDQLMRKRSALREMIVALKPQEKDEAKKSREAKREDDDEDDDRPEKDMKELKEKLSKDLDPLAEAVRKALSRALEDVQGALKKDGMTAEDLRRALEKSRDDLSDAMREGGPLEKEARAAAERARKDLEDALDRSLKDFHLDRDDLKGRLDDARERHKKQLDEMAERHRRMAEQQRKAIEEGQARMRREMERQREELRNRARSRRPEEKKEGRPKAEEKASRGGAGSDELDAARREIRELREQLRTANGRLEELRREPRRTAPPARQATPKAPERPAPPRAPAGARGRNDSDSRLRELEEKMDRLLKELQDLKGRTPSSR